ncbi:GH24 family phage-related lysozyme (muramidase) [Paucimonas lemoignei]|uniref:Lysozyme n=1 Tax=Paucimonas lemoignei TaxID=29443 RepID=A0A4R3HUG3_PAULE|nr:glycoside hydrolase family protein [Paucimonas lemoignei]TCS35811.1 GH24 family phage-related lysozyme (muramidase) [Paucimonas lemoignei]
MKKARIAVAALSLSAAGFIGIVQSEGYTDHAVIPTKNDRPTVGFGSTFHEDGSPVKMGDTTTPARALVKAQAHVSKEEAIFRKSLAGASLHQEEFDLYMDWVYQYGTGRWSESSMRRHLLAGDYVAACDALLAYKRAGGRDCSQPQNWGPKGCKGVWTRQLERHAKCMAMQ